MKEEMETDDDSFDYIYYTYGLNKYGNMPLIEPLESKEVYRIEDFVLVIDTSMSCSGELVKRFLRETYGVLSESESYFRKINVHIIQCDDQVRSDAVIRDREQMEAYMEHFAVAGFGGTDFRPAFAYVERLRKQGQFTRLRGLLYFTDGKGIYPVKMPPYDTAFVFVQDQYEDVSVPSWAIKLILEREHWKDEGGNED
jgi:predicted metal-dependent peptidase